MMCVLHGLLLTICLVLRVCFANTSLENELGHVVFANVIFRHGDRTPLDPYPSDPYKNTSYWPVGFGQLTTTGMEQHYELGQWLRNRYVSILPKKYSRDIIYVRSTDVDRTLMSAECNLAGMFPPEGDQVWNEGVQWQPIPVHTVPEKMDNMLAAKKPCPAYEKEFQELLLTEEIKSLNNSFLEVYKIVNQYSGEVVTTIERLDWLYNTLWIENLYKLTLPEWTKTIFPHRLEEASKYSFVLPTWTKKLGRLKSGLLVKEMINNMKTVKDTRPKPHRSLNIYSAHDTTLANLLNTMGVYNMINPPYTACVLMELRVNSSGDHQVTLFYRNSSTAEPFMLTLPGCTPICPLDQFIKLLDPVTMDDWDSECQASILSSYSTLTIIRTSIISGGKLVMSFADHLSPLQSFVGDADSHVLAALAVLVGVLLATGVIYWLRRRRATYWYRKLKTDNL